MKAVVEVKAYQVLELIYPCREMKLKLKCTMMIMKNKSSRNKLDIQMLKNNKNKL